MFVERCIPRDLRLIFLADVGQTGLLDFGSLFSIREEEV